MPGRAVSYPVGVRLTPTRPLPVKWAADLLKARHLTRFGVAASWSPALLLWRPWHITPFTIPDLRVHDPDPGVHHGRSWRSRWSETGGWGRAASLRRFPGVHAWPVLGVHRGALTPFYSTETASQRSDGCIALATQCLGPHTPRDPATRPRSVSRVLGGPMNSLSKITARFSRRGIPLPPLLVSLIREGRWRQPSDSVIQVVIPVLQGQPVDFARNEAEMRSFTAGARELVEDFLHQEQSDWHLEISRVAKSLPGKPVPDLPWLDIDLAIYIADNRNWGEDLAIALDYRSDRSDPRVVVTDHHWGGRGCRWSEVSPSFSQFVNQLGL